MHATTADSNYKAMSVNAMFLIPGTLRMFHSQPGSFRGVVEPMPGKRVICQRALESESLTVFSIPGRTHYVSDVLLSKPL